MLNWGDEAIARWESWRKGTPYEDELAHQRAIYAALREANPKTVAAMQAAGGLVYAAAMGSLPAAAIMGQMARAGALAAATGAVGTVGIAEDKDDWALRALVGGLASAPAAFLGPGYTAFLPRPSWLLQKGVNGVLGGGPGTLVQSQLPTGDW